MKLFCPNLNTIPKLSSYSNNIKPIPAVNLQCGPTTVYSVDYTEIAALWPVVRSPNQLEGIPQIFTAV